MHCAIKITPKTLPFIIDLNDGVALDDECLEQTTYFVWGDSFEGNRVMLARDYHNAYKRTVVVPIFILEERVSQAEKLANVLAMVEAQQQLDDIPIDVENLTDEQKAELDQMVAEANADTEEN